MDGHVSHSLERKILVRTPENLEVSYELAGAGTRAAAYSVDVLLMVLVLNIFQSLFAAMISPMVDEVPSYFAAIIGIIAFVYFNAYFMVFELLWAGQSPGKRLVGIRVIKTGGFALRFSDTLIRNLLRAVDFIPLFYGVGLVSLLLTRHCQRIGDLVAGTLVIYQEKNSPDALFTAGSIIDTANSFPTLKLATIPVDVVETCDEFLRIRDQLAPKYRQQIAQDLLELVERLSGLAPDNNQSAETFLIRLVTQFGQIRSVSSLTSSQTQFPFS